MTRLGFAERIVTPLLVVLIFGAAIVNEAASAHPRDASSLATLEARVAALEARVSALEGASPTPSPSPTGSPQPVPSPAPACAITVSTTGSVQAAVDAAGAGATVCLSSGTTYTLGSSLRVTDKAGLTIDGRGATLRASGYFTSGTAEIVYVSGGSGITFRDLTIVGTDAQPGYQCNPAPSGLCSEFQAGIAFAGTQGGLVERVTVRQAQGDGIGIYTRAGTPSRDITVRASVLSGLGRWGVTVTHAERVTIEGNTVTDTDKMFELEPDPAPIAEGISDVVIRGNTGTGTLYNLVAAYGPGPLARLLVEDNRVLAGPNRGIWSYIEPTDGFRASSITFRNNVGEQAFWEDPCATPCRAVFRFYHTDSGLVEGNTQPVTPGSGMVGVLAEDSTVTQTGNSFPGAG